MLCGLLCSGTYSWLARKPKAQANHSHAVNWLRCASQTADADRWADQGEPKALVQAFKIGGKKW
jgi:hypothetical protein